MSAVAKNDLEAVENVATVTALTDLAGLVGKRIELAAQMEQLKDQLGVVDAQIIEQLPVGTSEVDGKKVQIREYSRVDYAAVEKKYPFSDYPTLYAQKVALDQAAVKKNFAPAALDEFKVTGARSVVIS